jgi:hypothetical protein
MTKDQWNELAQQIDCEGGLAEFFTMVDHGPYGDAVLDLLATDFRLAFDRLKKYLVSKGGLV